jgi:mono/diheme cytochrome c family protein
MKTLLISIVLFVLAVPTAALADARMDFNAKCANCHRATGRMLKAAKQLNVDPKKLTLMTSEMSRDEMIAIIEKGKNKMPSFEKDLTKDQITAIADYILLFRKKR